METIISFCNRIYHNQHTQAEEVQDWSWSDFLSGVMIVSDERKASSHWRVGGFDGLESRPETSNPIHKIQSPTIIQPHENSLSEAFASEWWFLLPFDSLGCAVPAAFQRFCWALILHSLPEHAPMGKGRPRKWIISGSLRNRDDWSCWVQAPWCAVRGLE